MIFDLGIFLTTLGMVLLMEMGDKTQLLVMACASKYKPKHVLIGISIAIVALNALAVSLGSVIGGIRIIQDCVKAGASVLFIIFGLLSLREEDEGGESCSAGNNHKGVIITVALAFFLAEIGDKTQLSTFSFAALYPNSPVSVFTGSTLALIAADCIGLIAGAIALKYIPKKIMSYISASLFIVFGLISEWTALTVNFGISYSTSIVITGSTSLLAVIIASIMLLAQKKAKKRKGVM